jgi:hypothetical protein
LGTKGADAPRVAACDPHLARSYTTSPRASMRSFVTTHGEHRATTQPEAISTPKTSRAFGVTMTGNEVRANRGRRHNSQQFVIQNLLTSTFMP